MSISLGTQSLWRSSGFRYSDWHDSFHCYPCRNNSRCHIQNVLTLETCCAATGFGAGPILSKMSITTIKKISQNSWNFSCDCLYDDVLYSYN